MFHVTEAFARSILSLATCLTMLLAGTSADSAEVIRINGSGSGLDMMKPLMAAYAKAHRKITFQMEKPLGSSGAIKALLAGVLDIVVTSRQLNPGESAAGAVLQHFGKTPLAIVVGHNVPIEDISIKELEDIYAGATARWPNGEMVRVVLRPIEDIDSKILMGLSPRMSHAVARARDRRGMIVAVTDPESNEAVAMTSGSIGASGLTGIASPGTALRIVPLNGVMPSLKSISDGSYPLVKNIDFVTSARASESVREFLKFIYSGRGREIAARAGVLVTAAAKTGR